MTRDEAAKGQVELSVFERFARLRGLHIVPGSLVKRLPPEPDVHCIVEGEGAVGFEITEACAPEFAAAAARIRRSGEVPDCLWGSDVSADTIRKKLGKSYPVSYPIELILYAGLTALPDDVLKPTIAPIVVNGSGQFRRIWLLGDELVELTGSEG